MNRSLKSLLIIFLILFTIPVFAQKGGKKDKLKSRAGYDVIYPFKKGLNGIKMAKVEKDKKQGFIHEDGDEFVPCKYDNIYPWEKGRAKVEIKNQYGFINEAGEEYIPVKYDYIGPFKNGLAIVSLEGRRGLINEQGEEVVVLDNEK